MSKLGDEPAGTRFQWFWTGNDWTVAFIFNDKHFRIPGSATKHPMCAAARWGPVIEKPLNHAAELAKEPTDAKPT